ncbi:hypothetical protein [Antribacter gilvus]|uniref:hypothetical protein n=1 Tax=Antribacter gilvus TaxID=2304675 RepID=UPI000F794A46|nr:hypothetical protein [Antribacter gilvus]
MTVVVALALALAGCSVRIDGGPDGPAEDGTVQAVEEGDPMQWDLTRPVDAGSVGLPADEMVIVDVPEGGSDVELVLPSGTWSARAEQLTVTTSGGYVLSVDVFRTEADGDAAYARMSDEATLLGIDSVLLDDWHAGLPAVAGGDAGDRVKQTFNGYSGDVATSVQAGVEAGEGAGAPVRLWYAFYLRDLLANQTGR